MTLEEKLANFEESAITAATNENSKMIEEYKVSLDNEFEQQKEALIAKAKLNLETKSSQLITDSNKQLSNLTLDAKRVASDKSAEYSKLIFEDVRKKLMEFKKTDKYVDVLAMQAKKAIEFAQDSEIIIYIDPSDAALKDAVEKKCGHEITISHMDFMGGTRGVINEMNILIDNSFLTRLDEEQEAFII